MICDVTLVYVQLYTTCVKKRVNSSDPSYVQTVSVNLLKEWVPTFTGTGIL